MVTTPERLPSTIAARLKELVEDEPTKQKLASHGVPASTLQRLLGAKNVPNTDSLLRIAGAAGVSLDWLTGLTNERGGDGAPSSLGMVTQFGSSVPEGFVAVPALTIRPSAGNGTVPGPFDNEASEMVAFREAWLRSLGFIPNRVHILWATGDSMVPTIRDGDMMLIDRTIDRVVNDGIYVVVAAGTVRVKRVAIRQNGSVVLRSDNDRYPEELIPVDEVSQLIVEGRVRWVGGPI